MERVLTENTASVSAPRMGRPPLNKDSITKATLVRLTSETVERIDALAGPNRRAVFIREAVEAELIRRGVRK